MRPRAWEKPYLEALRLSGGNRTQAARACGITLSGVRSYFTRNPTFRAACEQVLAEVAAAKQRAIEERVRTYFHGATPPCPPK